MITKKLETNRNVHMSVLLGPLSLSLFRNVALLFFTFTIRGFFFPSIFFAGYPQRVILHTTSTTALF